MPDLELTSPYQPTVRDRHKRRPFYQPYDFSQDYYGPEDRNRIAEFLEHSGQDNLKERYEKCKRDLLLVKCKDGNSSYCQGEKYPDPYGDETERRGYYVGRASCRARFCEPCARAFGGSFRKKVRPFIRAIGTCHPRYGFKHLTLTFKRSDEEITPEWVRGAFKCASKLIRKFYHIKNRHGEFATGALAVMEMSPGGFFHLHCLVYGPYYDLKTQLSPAWLKITGDSYRVDISDAQGRSKRYPNLTPDQALNEVTKYVQKPVSAMLDELFQYITAIKGRRRIHTWGLFYNHPDLKPPKNKSRCPFCNSSVVLIAEYSPDELYLLDDLASYWPTWAVADGLINGNLPLRYD